MSIRIHAQALVVEHLSVRTLPSAHKQDKVVLGSKLRYVWHAVGYRTTDGVEALKGGIRRYVRLDVIDDAVKLVERLGGLRIEVDVACKIEFCNLVATLDDDSL